MVFLSKFFLCSRGRLVFSGLPLGQQYHLKPLLKEYAFSPKARTFGVPAETETGAEAQLEVEAGAGLQRFEATRVGYSAFGAVVSPPVSLCPVHSLAVSRPPSPRCSPPTNRLKCRALLCAVV